MEMKESRKEIYQPPETSKPWVSWLFFVVGAIPVFCFRLVTIAQHYSDILSKIVWYAAVVCSLIFFWFRYDISYRRYKTITVRELEDKIEKKMPLDNHDYESLHYILSSLIISKERLNYLLIFVASIISLAIAFYLDFFRP